MVFVNYNKVPLVFREDNNYDKWKKILAIWHSLTTLKAKKQERTIFITLDENSEDTVL